MTKPAINPGAGVARNVERHQLRGIIEMAKAGGYGPYSSHILARSEKRLKELGE